MIIFPFLKKVTASNRAKSLAILAFGFAAGSISFMLYSNYNNGYLTNKNSLHIKSSEFYSDADTQYDNYDNFEKRFEEIAKIHKKLQEQIFESINSPNHQKITKNNNFSPSRYQSRLTKSIADDKMSIGLDFTGYEVDDINVEITNNIVNFQSAVNKNEGSNNSSKISRSSFNYSLQIPKEYQVIKPNITRNKNSLIVTFNKKTKSQ